MQPFEPRRAPFSLLLAVFWLLVPSSAWASLDGQQVDLTYNFGNTSGTLSATVGAGNEFVLEGIGTPGFLSTGTIDITPTTVTLTHNRDTTLGPSLPNVSDDFLTFTFPNLPPQTLTSVTLTTDPMATWFAGLASTSDSITLTQQTTTAGVNTSTKVWTVVVETPPTSPSFTGLGDVAGGNFYSIAVGVSADGGFQNGPLVAVIGTSAAGLEWFTWDDGSIDVVGDLPGGSVFGLAQGLSTDGSTAVGVGGSASGSEAFRWTNGTGMVGLGDLAGGVFSSVATDVSGDGSVVVGDGTNATTTGTEAFRWTDGGAMVGLGWPTGYFGSKALGVSDDGSVVVGYGLPFSGLVPSQAFRWTSAGGFQLLGDLPGGPVASQARDISADGAVIVGSGQTATGFEAFRWTAGDGMVSIGDLPGGFDNAAAQAVSPDGSVVVGFSNSAAGTEAFIWDRVFGMRSLQTVLVNELGLDLTGWTLTEANAVDDDGLGTNESLKIAGNGINPSGDTEAWLVQMPVPSAPVPMMSLPAQALLVALLVAMTWATLRRPRLG